MSNMGDMKVWLDGELVEIEDARVPVSDRGLLVGDGVFETMRAYGGVTFALDEHIERLDRSAQVMRLALPPHSELAAAVRSVIEANSLDDARVRITVTAGSGPAGLAREETAPTALVTATPLASWPPTASAVVSPWPRNERSVLAGVKTTSNAENVAKLAHAHEQGADEALSINLAGNLCEGASSNVFVVHGGQVATPPLSAGCLAGITRERLLEVARERGIEIAEQEISAAALSTADEIFLTSSTRELQAVGKLDGKDVGDGQPGPTFVILAAAFSKMVRRELSSGG